MTAEDPIVVSLEDVPVDDSLTLQLRMVVEDGDVTNTVSTLWLKEDSGLTFESTLQEDGDDPELAGAAVRASLTAVDTEDRFEKLGVASGQSYDVETPDRPVVFEDGAGTRHET